MPSKIIFALLGALLALGAFTAVSATPALASHKIEINEAVLPNAPDWLTELRVQNVVDRISSRLEWDIRKIRVTFYSDQAAFQKLHGFGPSVLAFTMKKQNTITLGPRLTNANFDDVFGHELVHIILGQKYKDAIPPWLEEGLANYISKHGHVNYPWLLKQNHPDVRLMVHPFKSVVQSPEYQYEASEALIEMIDAKCGEASGASHGLDDMLELSVGSKLENYLATTCKIKDINASFAKWLMLKAKGGSIGSVEGNS